ncbi:MAG TPA: hypothetical protein VFQ23_20735 [Anaerolineales bacterium]|nr:hypothetical protein [Anaerolineales bacterium]
MIKMDNRDKINEYDLVEIIQVPERLEGIVDIGDIGVVLEKYDETSFKVECIQPGGSYKWLRMLDARHIRLRSRDPFSNWAKKSLREKSITETSITAGVVVGAASGALIGVGLGAITKSLNGLLTGLIIGLILGAVTGALTAALTVRTAGTTGGIGVGYFTGMIFGGVFGMTLGALVPASFRMRAQTDDLPLLDALMIGSFETAMLAGFLLSILATVVGVWVAGKNLVEEKA